MPPVVAAGGVEGLKAPEHPASALVAETAEDVEGHHAAGHRPAVGVARLDAELHLVEDERALRPLRLAVGLEDDRREHLDEVGNELSVAAVPAAVLAVGMAVRARPYPR